MDNEQKNETTLPPALTKEEVLAILKEINEKTKGRAAKLQQMKQQIEQQIAQSGQQVDESEIMKQFILPNFTKGVQEIEEEAYSNFNNGEGVLEEEFREGVEYYKRQGDEDVEKAVAKLRKIYSDMGGEKIVDDDNEDDMSSAPRGPVRDIPIEEVIKILEAYAEALSRHTEM